MAHNTSSQGRRLFPAALLVVAVACGDVTAPGVPVLEPKELTSGTWYMHSADGEDLPAKISERNVGVALEETFVDSARLVVSVNGVWRQSYWIRVNVSGNLDREELITDEGIWGPPFSAVYGFTSSIRARAFSVTVVSDDEITSSEKLLFYVGASAVTGVYRTARP